MKAMGGCGEGKGEGHSYLKISNCKKPGEQKGKGLCVAKLAAPGTKMSGWNPKVHRLEPPFPFLQPPLPETAPEASEV